MIVGALNTPVPNSNLGSPVYWLTTATPPNPLQVGTGNTVGNAAGVNASGIIVGVVGTNNTFPSAVYWKTVGDAPSPLQLGTGNIGGYAGGINDSSIIVGAVITVGPNSNIIPAYWKTTLDAPIPLLGFLEGLALGVNASGAIVGINGQEDSIPIYWKSVDDLPISLQLGAGNIGGYAYGISASGIIVGAVKRINEPAFPVYWKTADDEPTPLQLGTGNTFGYAFGINASGTIVGSVGLTEKTLNAVYWLNVDSPPTPLQLSGGATFSYAGGINDTDASISNICFPAGTPILTDQGIITIEKIDILKHTINGESIRYITQTVTLDKYLISFGKNSLERNIPNQTTIMSKDHQIEFQGKLVPAYRFLDVSAEVKKVKYSGEILYNILLGKHGRVNVNGLICETLHPENNIAKLYNNYSEGERYTIISQMNEALGKRDALMYKEIVNKLAQRGCAPLEPQH